MQERPLSPQQSLKLIENMISKTREDISRQSPYFLLWGWGTLIGCVGQFVLKVLMDYERHYLVWLITIPELVLTFYLISRQRKRTQIRTYIAENMRTLWLAVGICFLILSLLFIKVGWLNCFPFFMLLYGLGSFVSGKILRFNAFIVGGIISWLLAAIAIWFDFDYQAIFAAAAILFGYIIPGHLFRNMREKEKSSV